MIVSRDQPDTASTAKGEARKRAIIEAAASIIRESGPKEVTHRAVAERAKCSLSATTYYFDGLDDLLYQAGLVNIGLWAARAERVADAVESLKERPDLEKRIDFLLRATLPEKGPYLGHYLQLISASSVTPVASAYRAGRHRLNAAISRIAECFSLHYPAEIIVAIVDGAVITALSEGHNVRETAATLLRFLDEQAP